MAAHGELASTACLALDARQSDAVPGLAQPDCGQKCCDRVWPCAPGCATEAVLCRQKHVLESALKAVATKPRMPQSFTALAVVPSNVEGVAINVEAEVEAGGSVKYLNLDQESLVNERARRPDVDEALRPLLAALEHAKVVSVPDHIYVQGSGELFKEEGWVPPEA